MRWRVEKRLMRPSQAPTVRRKDAEADAAGGTSETRHLQDHEGPPEVEPAATRTKRKITGGTGPLVLDRYRLTRRLGAGGVRHRLARARRAARSRRRGQDRSPRERVIGGRFEREARAAARLAHPGIVTLYEAWCDDEGAYLVSELVNGQTLDSLLEHGRLSDRDIVEIGLALCDALDHAHAHGVVHRDVKPSNVLVPDRADGGEYRPPS